MNAPFQLFRCSQVKVSFGRVRRCIPSHWDPFDLVGGLRDPLYSRTTRFGLVEGPREFGDVFVWHSGSDDVRNSLFHVTQAFLLLLLESIQTLLGCKMLFDINMVDVEVHTHKLFLIWRCVSRTRLIPQG